MGRLLNPGIGEYVDRLTILRLKIEHAPKHVDTMNFHIESAAIQMRLDASFAATAVHANVPVLIDELWECNRRLWILEEMMAEYAKQEGDVLENRQAQKSLARLGVRIWRANRRRNALIADLNSLFGSEHVEKF